jgi:hypothetical protein
VGWDFWNKPQTMTTKEAIVKDLEREDGTSPVVDISVVGTVGYVAYRTREDTIVGVVVLTARQRGHFNFGTKMMDEHMGPYNFDCPASMAPTPDSPTRRWAIGRSLCRLTPTFPVPSPTGVSGNLRSSQHPGSQSPFSPSPPFIPPSWATGRNPWPPLFPRRYCPLWSLTPIAHNVSSW